MSGALLAVSVVAAAAFFGLILFSQPTPAHALLAVVAGCLMLAALVAAVVVEVTS